MTEFSHTQLDYDMICTLLTDKIRYVSCINPTTIISLVENVWEKRSYCIPFRDRKRMIGSQCPYTSVECFLNQIPKREQKLSKSQAIHCILELISRGGKVSLIESPEEWTTVNWRNLHIFVESNKTLELMTKPIEDWYGSIDKLEANLDLLKKSYKKEEDSIKFRKEYSKLTFALQTLKSVLEGQLQNENLYIRQVVPTEYKKLLIMFDEKTTVIQHLSL